MSAPESIYLEDGKKLTVQVEWMESHLLLYDQYHRFDDTSRMQTHQMRRELEVLQAENYALEKQVHSYQQSIAKNHAKGRFTKDHLVHDRQNAIHREHRDSAPAVTTYHRDASPTTNYYRESSPPTNYHRGSSPTLGLKRESPTTSHHSYRGSSPSIGGHQSRNNYYKEDDLY